MNIDNINVWFSNLFFFQNLFTMFDNFPLIQSRQIHNMICFFIFIPWFTLFTSHVKWMDLWFSISSNTNLMYFKELTWQYFVPSEDSYWLTVSFSYFTSYYFTREFMFLFNFVGAVFILCESYCYPGQWWEQIDHESKNRIYCKMYFI